MRLTRQTNYAIRIMMYCAANEGRLSRIPEIASAYSVRGTPEGIVSAPLRWDEIAEANPRDFTIATMPARYAAVGDLHAAIDDHVYRLDELLEWADRDERDNKAVPNDMGPPDTE